MKNLILTLVLLVSVFGFAQAEKDSLLRRDAAQIKGQLNFMLYLHKIAMKGKCMGYMDKLKSDREFGNIYANEIVLNNPEPSLDVTQYLGRVPNSWDEFMAVVYNRNFETIMADIEKYGYLTVKRFPESIGLTSPVTFVMYVDKDKRKAYHKLLKKEYKIKNLSKEEYESSMFFTNINGASREEFNRHFSKAKLEFETN
jgi:hypothetical protein